MLLALDTSGPFCSAALLNESGVIVAYKSEDLGRGHAERLMPMIEEVLNEAKIEWSGLSSVAVVTGPGSFTGLRVGLATARGLALACGIPCHGISVFAAFTEEHGVPLTVALDARRGEIWLQKMGGSQEPLALGVEEAVSLIQPDTRVAGSAVTLFLDTGIPFKNISDAPSPPIAAVGRVALKQTIPHPPVPLYLRAPDAKPQKLQAS